MEQDGNILLRRIETWKKLLLDFGKRNRLINFKETKLSNVVIAEPSFGELFERIQKRDLRFPFAKKVKVEEDGEESYDQVVRGNIETNRPVGDLQKTLKVLRRRANTSIEETGINTLFLAFGMLRWTEVDHSEQELASPLVLVPVKLTIESLASPYVLSLHEDEIVVNPTLVHKLHNDFGIVFPEFDASIDGIEPYLSQLERLIENKQWKITKEVHLTILSFLKINMYKDLERNEEKLNKNAIISALGGVGSSLSIPDGLDNYDHDNNTKPIETYQVVDADSSQQDAILLSKKGVSFVLQGPPGTGKSQTITNIIAEALADGKKVLFVSEKRAAIQVVYDRLRKVELSDFCLALHSHKANKKEILQELESSINTDKRKVKDEVFGQLSTLQRKRNELNQYQRELHTPCSALEISIFEANGRYAQLAEAPDVVFDILHPEAITREELDDKKYLLSELSKTIGRRSENYANNVWRNAGEITLTHELRHNIDSYFSDLVPPLRVLNESFRLFNEQSKLDIPPSVSNANWLISFMSVASKSPSIPSKWVLLFNDAKLTHIGDIADKCSLVQEDMVSIRHEIQKRFDKQVFELDYYPLLKKFRGEYQSAFRSFKRSYRDDIKAIRLYLADESKLDYTQAFALLKMLKQVADKKSEIKELIASCRADINDYYCGEHTDYKKISEGLKFAAEFKKLFEQRVVPNHFVEKVCEDETFVAHCAATLPQLTASFETVEEKLKWVHSLFDDSVELENYDINDLIVKFDKCRDNKHLLEEWVDYLRNRRGCERSGLLPYLDVIEDTGIETDLVVGAYLKRFYALWLDAMLLQFPALQSFRGENHNQLIAEFSQLDKAQLKIAQKRIRERVLGRFPDFNSATSTRDEVGVLKRELHKQRRIMPLRKLFAAIPNLLPTLRPCFMMSPLSVSVFLEAQSYTFDLVIFDEASQVHTEDAVGAIMRGKQVIIVGDTKQLPPTNFFAAAIDDEDYDAGSDDKDYDTGAYQSILDESITVLPERSLRWHYRSRHEHLIAFSNAKIYNNSLITFPSKVEGAEDSGVEYVYVADGFYDRGGKRNNINEAKRVAELVFEHIAKHPKRSLGVVTFSEAQQLAVEAAINQKRLEDERFEPFFAEDSDEPFFIKNLETVQGDERDTIIFSIGYAKTMNFGPLSRDGGHRRLNVAITRAKHNIKLVGSINPTDIDIERTSSEGVKLLRSYIEFARQGIVALQKEVSYTGGEPEFDSPFEEAVYYFLISRGYQVQTQVGCSGFRIDMAVKHPTLSGVFAIGIECDGATYHSARTARERDRIRQAILEDMDWTIHRIWSTDWIKSRKSEEQKLVEEIEAAIEKALQAPQCDHTPSTSPQEEQLVEEVAISQINMDEVVGEDEDILNQSNRYGFSYYCQADMAGYASWETWSGVRKVIDVEQPIHIEDLCQRVAPLFGNIKATSKVRDNVDDLLRARGADVSMADEFINLVGSNKLKVRVPRPDDAYIRPIKFISDAELILAMLTIASKSFGLIPDDLISITAREFGFKRIGDNIAAALRRNYENLLMLEWLKEVDGKVTLCSTKKL